MANVRWRSWLVLAAFSVLNALITVAIYTALGIVLPLMVKDEGWSWTAAGFGFTVIGACIGGSSYLPALMIRRVGVRTTLLAGTGLVTAGLACLAFTRSLPIYYLGAAFCGVGYQMMALIPATHVLQALFKRKSSAFGIYFTLSSALGAGGPILVLGLLRTFGQDWRQVWVAEVFAALVIGVICALAMGGRAWLARESQRMDAELAVDRALPKPVRLRVHRTEDDWTLAQALRTPQFYILLFAYFGHVLCMATTASFAMAHLTEHGVPTLTVGAMLTVEGLVGLAWRFLAGVLGDILDPRYLLLFALGALVAGMFALSVGHDYVSLIVFAVGTGIGFTVTALTVTVLVLDYFGRRHNLEIFSTICMVGAVSALGPLIGGFMRDHLGGFAPTFQIFAALNGVVFLAVLFMRPPHRAPRAAGDEAAPPPVFANDLA